MIIDSILSIDSHIYPEVQYQPGDELYVCAFNSSQYKDILVFDVSEHTFLELYKDPTHEKLMEIIKSHHYKFI